MDMQEWFEKAQQFMDAKTKLEFNEIDGIAVLVNAIAAGAPHYAFQFISGPYRGKTLVCEICDVYFSESEEKVVGFAYRTNVNSDGFLFNWTGNKQENYGNFIAKLNGISLTLKK